MYFAIKTIVFANIILFDSKKVYLKCHCLFPILYVYKLNPDKLNIDICSFGR